MQIKTAHPRHYSLQEVTSRYNRTPALPDEAGQTLWCEADCGAYDVTIEEYIGKGGKKGVKGTDIAVPSNLAGIVVVDGYDFFLPPTDKPFTPEGEAIPAEAETSVEHCTIEANQLLLSVKGKTGTPITLNLFDANGRLLQTWQLLQDAEVQTWQLPLDNLPQGMMLLKVMTGNFTQTIPLTR